MEKKNEVTKIAMLEYQIHRYQMAGKGAKCQSLHAELQKLRMGQISA